MYKINRLGAYITILSALFFQIYLGNLSFFNVAKPNILLIVTVFFGLFTDKKFGCRAGLISGLLLDIFSIRFFGLNTVLYALAGYIVGKYNGKFYRDSTITHFIITFAVSFFVLWPYFLFVSLRRTSVLSAAMPDVVFTPSILFSSLLNSFFAIFIFAIFLRVFKLDECEL